ncbi:hypothetical protein Tco_0481926 [Tanacetum coccineum]
MVVHNQEEIGEGSTIPTDPHHTPTFIQPSPQPQKTQKPWRPKKKDTKVPQSSVPSDNVADEAVYKELDDSLVRAATNASSLEAKQDSGNIIKTRSKPTPNEASSQGTTSGGGPKRQETMGDTIAQTRFENVSKLSNDPLLAIGNTLRSGQDSLKLNELMELCTNLQQRVLDLETTKTTQANEIATGEEVFVVEQSGNVVEEVVDVIDAASTIPVSAAIITDVEITLAQALAELKSAKPKADKVVIQEPEQGTTTTTPTTIIHVPKPPQDKGKGIMIEEPVVEQVKPMKRLEQMRLDEELAFKLQAEEEEEERLAREKAQQIEEANIAWDDVQAKVEADYQLAQRLQAQEQEELTDEEKARLFVQFLEQRRKHFAAKRAEEKRNRPPTRAQQRNIMCTYLKNMEGWKPKSLKNKSFANIQELTEVMEGSSKRAGTGLEQEVTKKQKVNDIQETAEVDDDQETAKIKELMEIIPNKDEVAINDIPLAVKPPRIVDWKIYKKGKKTYYQIIRVDRSSKMYLVFSHMLKSFDRELEDIYGYWIVGIKRLLDDLRVTAAQVRVTAAKLKYPTTRTTDLDAYDSDCDDLSLAKAVLMTNLLSYVSDVLSEESQDAAIHDTNSSAPNDLLVLSLVEQITDHIAHLDKENQTNKIVNESLTAGLERYKERVTIFEQRLNEI